MSSYFLFFSQFLLTIPYPSLPYTSSSSYLFVSLHRSLTSCQTSSLSLFSLKPLVDFLLLTPPSFFPRLSLYSHIPRTSSTHTLFLSSHLFVYIHLVARSPRISSSPPLLSHIFSHNSSYRRLTCPRVAFPHLVTNVSFLLAPPLAVSSYILSCFHCNRCTITPESLRNRFAFIAELLCVHCGTALRSLRNRFAFIAELLCVHCGTALSSLRNRFAYIAKLPCVHCGTALSAFIAESL